MDVEIDPIKWILGLFASYALFAVLLLSGSIIFYRLSHFYFGRSPRGNTPILGEEPLPVRRPATPPSLEADRTAPHCPACGARISAEGAYCQWCGAGNKTESSPLGATTPSAADQAVSSEAKLAQVAVQGGGMVAYAKAPLGRRYVAFLLDALIATGLALSGVALMALVLSLTHLMERFPVLGYAAMLLMLMAYVLMVVGAVWFFVYYFLKDSWHDGASLGKRAMGLMVVDIRTNTPCSRRQSIIRTVGYFLPLTQVFDPMAVLTDPRGRRVGDHLAGTQVIAVSQYAIRMTPR